jgi:hypothetical protein
MQTLRRLLLVALLCSVGLAVAGILSAGVACAHDPRFACSPRPQSNPIVVRDVAKSWAYYGRLSGGERDYYSLATAITVHVPLSLLVDVRDAGNLARPRLSLFDDRHRAVATVDLRHSEHFYEPFSHVRYLSSDPRAVRLLPGKYTMVVSMEGGSQPQRYVAAIGEKERFGLLELPYVTGAIYRIHNRKLEAKKRFCESFANSQ